MDQDAVKVEATRHYHGAEEKEVPYRKREPSEETIKKGDGSQSSSSSNHDSSSSESSTTDRAAMAEFLKELFCAYIDVQNQVDIGNVSFEWDKSAGVNFHALARKISEDE